MTSEQVARQQELQDRVDAEREKLAIYLALTDEEQAELNMLNRIERDQHGSFEIAAAIGLLERAGLIKLVSSEQEFSLSNYLGEDHARIVSETADRNAARAIVELMAKDKLIDKSKTASTQYHDVTKAVYTAVVINAERYLQIKKACS